MVTEVSKVWTDQGSKNSKEICPIPQQSHNKAGKSNLVTLVFQKYPIVRVTHDWSGAQNQSHSQRANIHQGNSAASGPPRLAALGADGNNSFHCVAEATNEMTTWSHALCLLLNCLTWIGIWKSENRYIYLGYLGWICFHKWIIFPSNLK